ncbi:MAG: ABC transporter ATP-binding protein [Candidatus Saliniplasma sp.]
MVGYLNVKELTTGYGEKVVLKNISFDLKDGEVLGVIGPNGSGKSTLIKALTGVLPIWSGEVRYEGKNIEGLDRRERARVIGVVPQDTFINFPFSSWEVVMMGRNPYMGRFENPKKDDDRAVKEAMKSTKTLKFKDRSVRELSGGELQRVVVARALAQEPRLIFLDEATSHLDIGHKLEIMELMKDRAKLMDVGVLSIHHNLNLAARYCDNIVLLDDGEVHAKGSPKKVLTRAHLRAVYGIEAEVDENPMDGSLYITPIKRKVIKENKEEVVHVICGGGTGRALLKELVEQGFEVTTGVLNVMDSDQNMAEFLDLRCVTEAPFSSISERTNKENLNLIEDADIVVGTDFAVGPGNLDNLKALLRASESGKRVLLLERKEFQKRNHVGIEGERMYRELTAKMNVKTFTGIDKLIRQIHEGNI